MGTDIHLFVETLSREGVWQLAVDAPRYRDRNYDSFAILADVRNGEGFAGCDTGDGFVPIAEPRGLPEDMSAGLREIQGNEYSLAREEAWEQRCDEYRKRYGASYLGDHSFSYLTLAELLRYNWNQWTNKRGTVGPKEFVVFSTTGAPDNWCGGVSGPSVRLVSNEEMSRLVAAGVGLDEERMPGVFNKWHVYTGVQWSVSYKEAAPDLHARFIPALTDFARRRRLETDEVRIVFGFDS